MRISDWSSDVCSSDLLHLSLDYMNLGAVDHFFETLVARSLRQGGPAPDAGRRPRFPRSEERREGKSVSVRVDLGGRRIIKKKKIKENIKEKKHETQTRKINMQKGLTSRDKRQN